MSLKHMFAAFSAAVFLIATPLSAQTVTDGEKAAIQIRIDAFTEVMKLRDRSGYIDFIPVRMQEHIASRNGLTVEKFKHHIQHRFAVTHDYLPFEDFGMDLENTTFASTPDGSRVYWLVPTFAVMAIEGRGSIRAESKTLAMQDEGEWHLIGVDDPENLEALSSIYPEFSGILFPPATITPVE